MQAFAGIADATRDDVYLHPHVRYYVREVRVVAYSQVWAMQNNANSCPLTRCDFSYIQVCEVVEVCPHLISCKLAWLCSSLTRTRV